MSSQPPFGLGKVISAVVMFLLRRQWVGKLSDNLMLLTHTGRKSGKKYTIPIAYLRDDKSILGNAMGSRENWYQNIQQNPTVLLEIRGEQFTAQAEAVHDAAEVAHVLSVYKRAQPRSYGLFGVPREMPADEAAQSPKLRVKFVRFHPTK